MYHLSAAVVRGGEEGGGGGGGYTVVCGEPGEERTHPQAVVLVVIQIDNRDPDVLYFFSFLLFFSINVHLFVIESIVVASWYTDDRPGSSMYRR